MKLSIEQRVVKRAFDLLMVAVLGALTAFPCAVYVAYARFRNRRLPTIVSDLRFGRGGRPFLMLRLRTRIRDRNWRRADQPSGRVERLVERYGLDEVPQLWNVLRGEMTIVGPRPRLGEELAQATPVELQALVMKPGIVGPAQISSRSAMTSRDLLHLELGYALGWTIFRDLAILAAAPFRVLARGWRGETEILRDIASASRRPPHGADRPPRRE